MLPRSARRLCTHRLPPRRLFSQVAVAQDNQLPRVDWEDWLLQYPRQVRDNARTTVVNPSRASEATTAFNPTEVPKIDWEDWRKRIRSPEAVDWLQAEYEAIDNSNYGLFHYDDLTDEARAALLSSGENSAEVESVGREAIENGVQKTLEEQANTRLETAEKLSEHATKWLEEVYKDKEQIDAQIKGYLVRSPDMDYAEYPSVHRELEEWFMGNSAGGTGSVATYGASPLVSAKFQRQAIRSPYMHDAGIQEEAIEAEEDNLLEIEESMKNMGFEFDPEKFKDEAAKDFWKGVHEHREEMWANFNKDYVNPANQSGRQFEDTKYYETPGAG